MKTWVQCLISSTFRILKSYMPDIDAQERANNLGQVFASDPDTEIVDEELDQLLTPSAVKVGIPDLDIRKYVIEEIKITIWTLRGNLTDVRAFYSGFVYGKTPEQLIDVFERNGEKDGK